MMKTEPRSELDRQHRGTPLQTIGEHRSQIWWQVTAMLWIKIL